MRFGNAEIPEDLIYTKNHLWVKTREGFCALGWTDYIQQNAGDVNYVDLPSKGSTMEVGEEFGTIETSKWVDRLYSPVSGQVEEVNERIVENPGLINAAPFSQGWFVKVRLGREIESEDAMSPVEYLEYIKACYEA